MNRFLNERIADSPVRHLAPQFGGAPPPPPPPPPAANTRFGLVDAGGNAVAPGAARK